MKSDKVNYRNDVADLIRAELEKLPICSQDGKPCLTPERHIVWFGCMASDGKEEIECFCSRFKRALNEKRKTS